MIRAIGLSLVFLLMYNVSYSQDTVVAQDTVVVGYDYSAPFVYKKNEKLQGPLVWLWEKVSEKNNIVTELKRVKSENMLELLESGDIDISLYPLTITSDRSQVIDFTAPYYLAYSGVLEPRRSTWEKAILFIKSFFSLNFFRALLGLMVIILIFGLLEWLFERKNNQEEFAPGLKGIWSGFWWSAVTMTTVGYGDKSPRTTGGRVIALIWMFTAVTIVSGFTASIASSLTLTGIGSDSTSVEKFKDKKIAAVANSSTLKWMNDNFYNNQVVFDRKEELVAAVKKGRADVAFYDLPLLKELIKEDSTQELRILPIRFNPQFYAFAMNQELPAAFKKQISTSMLEFTENLEWDVVLSEYGLTRN